MKEFEFAGSECVVEVVPHKNRAGEDMLITKTTDDAFGMVVRPDGGEAAFWYPVPLPVVDALLLNGLMPGWRFLVSRNKLAAPDRRWKVRRIA